MPSVSCTSSCIAASAIQVTATLDVSAGNQSIADNYTTINYSYRAVRNNYGFVGTTRDNVGTLQVLINGSVVKSVAVGLTYDGDGGNTECSGSGSVNVGHNADGTKSCSYQVKIVGGSDPRGANYQWNSSASSAPSMSLTAIPRATQPSMSASSVTMGNAITINTPRAADAFTHSLWYQVNGGNWQGIASGVTTSYSWTVPIGLASSVPNGTSISVTVICRTFNGSTNLGDKYTSFTAYVPSSVVPSMGDPTATIVDNGVPSSWGVYVKGYSKVTIAITSASGSYGSTIKSYSITGPNLSSTSSSATSGVLGSAGTNTYTCTITDSRGRSVSKTVSISVVDYSKPSISVTASRCNSDGTVSSSGTYLRVTASYSIASVSSKNSVSSRSVSCNGASNTSFSSGSAFVLGANCAINTSYTLTASVKDALNNTASVSITIPTASRIMNVRANKSGIAFGKFAESDNLVDFGWPINAAGTLTPVSRSFPSDLNTVYTPGVYSIKDDTANRPCDYGLLLVYVANNSYSNPDHNNDSNWLYQIAFDTNGNYIYIRRKINNMGFSSWSLVLTSHNYTDYSPINIKDSSGKVLTFNTDADNTSDTWLLVRKNNLIQHRRVDTLPFLSRYSPNGYEPIRYFSGDQYGDTMVVGLGGSVVIGSGESAQTCIDQWGTAISGNESLDLISDTYVTIHTNLQNGYSNQKTFSFKQDGTLTGGVFGWGYTEGNGIYGFADCGTYLEIRTASHGAKGINWWDSDASLKKNIKNTEVRYALEKISQLKHVEFDWKENDSHVDLGYVADDVKKVLPCLVFEVAQYGEDGKPNGESIKNIDHRTMIPLITMGMQELIEERDLLWTFDEEAANCIIQLREEVDSLKSTVNELKAEIESLKKAISV